MRRVAIRAAMNAIHPSVQYRRHMILQRGHLLLQE